MCVCVPSSLALFSLDGSHTFALLVLQMLTQACLTRYTVLKSNGFVRNEPNKEAEESGSRVLYKMHSYHIQWSSTVETVVHIPWKLQCKLGAVHVFVVSVHIGYSTQLCALTKPSPTGFVQYFIVDRNGQCGH